MNSEFYLASSLEAKAVLSDISNTVVASGRKEPTTRVTQTFQRVSNDVYTGVITGRQKKRAVGIIDQLGVSGLSVLSYGAQIYDSRDGVNEVIQEFPLERDVIKSLIQDLKDKDTKFWIQDNGIDYSDEDAATYRPEKPLMLIAHGLDNSRAIDLKNYFNETDQFGPINVFSGNARQDGLENLFITSEHATKLHGLTTVAEILHIDPKKIVGMGDSYPDVDFIEASTGVAMGNAVTEAKNKAVFVAPSVDKDGAAVALDIFFTKNHVRDN